MTATLTLGSRKYVNFSLHHRLPEYYLEYGGYFKKIDT